MEAPTPEGDVREPLTAESLPRYVALYNARLIRYFMEGTSCNQQDAEDAAQLTWERLSRQVGLPPSQGGYDITYPFPTYISNFAKFMKRRLIRFLVDRQKRERLVDFKDEIEEEVPGVMRTPAGEGPTASEAVQAAELARKRVLAFREMHRLLFLCGGYPHQQFCYGFSKMIYGAPSPRGIEGDPGAIAQEHGGTPLDLLSREYVEAFVKETGIQEESFLDWLREDVAVLGPRLAEPVEELVRLDAATARVVERLPAQRAGQTRIRDYHREEGGRPLSAAIADWTNRTGQRLRVCLGLEDEDLDGNGAEEGTWEVALEAREAPGKSGVCVRCKLRHLPPCSGSGEANP